jgi:hypothetical protein
MRNVFFPKNAGFPAKPVDNSEKTVDNLTRLWITLDRFSKVQSGDHNATPIYGGYGQVVRE